MQIVDPNWLAVLVLIVTLCIFSKIISFCSRSEVSAVNMERPSGRRQAGHHHWGGILARSSWLNCFNSATLKGSDSQTLTRPLLTLLETKSGGYWKAASLGKESVYLLLPLICNSIHLHLCLKEKCFKSVQLFFSLKLASTDTKPQITVSVSAVMKVDRCVPRVQEGVEHQVSFPPVFIRLSLIRKSDGFTASTVLHQWGDAVCEEWWWKFVAHSVGTFMESDVLNTFSPICWSWAVLIIPLELNLCSSAIVTTGLLVTTLIMEQIHNWTICMLGFLLSPVQWTPGFPGG